MKLTNKIKNYLFYIILGVRPFTRVCAQRIATAAMPAEKILEIGSGWPSDNGEYYFSVKKYFVGKPVDFIQSDLDPSYGLPVVDVVNFSDEEVYDRIMCFHVLDDIWDWQVAWKNLFRAVKKGGSLHIILPVFSKLDMSRDLFRFTEKLIRRFCQENSMHITEFVTKGFTDFPFAYYITIKK